MDGLIAARGIIKEGALPDLIHAAAIFYGLIFLHPFENGNGRIRRFLIHNILSLRGAVPKGLMFPISADMLKNPALYDHSL
jgi:Fic family protein